MTDCPSRKIAYRSKAAARRHAIHQQHRTGDRMAPYWCELCRHWHLTTPTPGQMHPRPGHTPTPRGHTPTPRTTATVAELDAFLARHAHGPRHDEDDQT